MATTTPNFGWSVPTSSDLVKNGATAIETLGDSIDASLVDLKGGTTGQVLSKASSADMDFTWVADATGDTTLITMIQQYTATESVLKNVPSRVPVAEQLLKQAVYWIDAAQSDNSDQVLDNQGWGAAALTTQLGSSASADSNDPKFLDWDGTNYVYLTGVASNFLSVPDAAALDITGDIDIRWYGALDDWTPTINGFIAKSGGAGAQSWRFFVQSNGNLYFSWSADGTNFIATNSTAPVPVADGAPIWVRVTLDVDNGASGNTVTFYTSTNGTSWSQLGSTVVTAGVTSIFNSTAVVSIDTVYNLTGKFYRAQILNGIDGVPVLDIDTSIIGSGSATSFGALTGQTVTINRSTSGKKTSVVTHPLWLFGTDDYMEVADNDLIDFAATDSFTLVAIQRQWATFGTNDAIMAKKANTTLITAGYLLGDDGTTAAIARLQIGDGAAGTAAETASRVAGTLNTLAAVRNVTADNLIVYLNGTAGSTVTDTTTTTLANAEVFRIGRLSGAGTEYNDMELVAAAIFRRALTAAEISTITNYYTARVG